MKVLPFDNLMSKIICISNIFFSPIPFSNQRYETF